MDLIKLNQVVLKKIAKWMWNNSLCIMKLNSLLFNTHDLKQLTNQAAFIGVVPVS